VRRDEWDEADARGEVAPRVARAADGSWVVAGSSPEEPDRLRARLEGRAGQLAADLAAIERQERPADGGSRPQYGKRIGDHTSDALETRRNVAAADTLRLQQAEVRRALAKLDEGSYGRCDGCGEPIGQERLEALPWAAECLRCRARAGRR
jgi:DnaK suppressor protein